MSNICLLNKKSDKNHNFVVTTLYISLILNNGRSFNIVKRQLTGFVKDLNWTAVILFDIIFVFIRTFFI